MSYCFTSSCRVSGSILLSIEVLDIVVKNWIKKLVISVFQQNSAPSHMTQEYYHNMWSLHGVAVEKEVNQQLALQYLGFVESCHCGCDSQHEENHL